MSPPTFHCGVQLRQPPDPGQSLEVYPDPLPRTPDGQAWQCPDCDHWASLEDNATFHRNHAGHGQPTLVPLEEAKERSLNRPRSIRTVRKPRFKARKMWYHHGGEVLSYSEPILVDIGDRLVKVKPRPVLVIPL